MGAQTETKTQPKTETALALLRDGRSREGEKMAIETNSDTETGLLSFRKEGGEKGSELRPRPTLRLKCKPSFREGGVREGARTETETEIETKIGTHSCRNGGEVK